jgi:hypothetical protein
VLFIIQQARRHEKNVCGFSAGDTTWLPHSSASSSRKKP